MSKSIAQEILETANYICPYEDLPVIFYGDEYYEVTSNIKGLIFRVPCRDIEPLHSIHDVVDKTPLHIHQIDSILKKKGYLVESMAFETYLEAVLFLIGAYCPMTPEASSGLKHVFHTSRGDLSVSYVAGHTLPGYPDRRIEPYYLGEGEGDISVISETFTGALRNLLKLLGEV